MTEKKKRIPSIGEMVYPETFDFSHLNYTETVDVTDREGNVIFTAVIGELTHGEKADIQMRLMQNVDIPIGKNKASNERKMQASMKDAIKNGSIMESGLYEEIASIKSWTLVDANGADVPISIEAWKALPVFITAQIEKVIERLNPDLDAEFHSES